MNAIVKHETTAIQSAASVRQHVNLIQEVMQAVMKKEVHYGTIPGTQKPTLYKPGAEVLCTTFRLAPTYPLVEDLSKQGVSRYRVTCRLTHQTSGVVMGDGMGSCSSEEEKYKWRRPVCDKEFDQTPETMRRVKFARGKGKEVYENKQIRTEPADVDNTILKMAIKRAFIAAVLNVLAASDIFTQDIEDLPEELRDNDVEQEPQPKQAAPKPPYPADQFEKNLPTWKDLVDAGKKKPKDILATVESKYTLSNEQHSKISNLGEQQ
jgi:hypothetical protein